MTRRKRNLATGIALLGVLAASCAPPPEAQAPPATLTLEPEPTVVVSATPLPTRGPHPPGELVDYTAQTGDTLPALAAHFNTTVVEILAANPQVPPEVTTLPPGYPLRIPAYYLPLTGSPFRILPDSEFVNGPSAVGFDIRDAIKSHPGFLAGMSDYAFGRERPAWEVVGIVAQNYSIHPRLLLTLLEHHAHALTDPFPDELTRTYPLGVRDPYYRGLYRQLLWAAETLSNGYYGWRSGELRELDLEDGLLVRPDPWQNAASVAVQALYAKTGGMESFNTETGPGGLYATYVGLWGDPFEYAVDFIPGDLVQPDLTLPFVPNRIWDFTAGPHWAWGESLPLGALDFAPPAMEGGCTFSSEWVAAPAPGVIVRSASAQVTLDLDGDGDDRTGWVLFFFHVAAQDRIAAGTRVVTGDLIGHPSCEGGRATGTHVHIARLFNGEWLPAGGSVPFVLDGWAAANGAEPYLGTLTKGSQVVSACTCTSRANRVIYELGAPALP